MKKRPSSSPSMSTQLQIWTPEKKRESSRRMDVAIVSTSHGTSFNLPDDWIFEERKRTTGTHIGRTDKYYREPGTGRTFRSLASVRKYLMELDDYAIARTRREENQITVYRKTYIPKHHVKIDRSKPLKLPKGWYIRRITRMSGHSMGRVDKYYCERSTGRVFRSRLDVQRYLAANHINDNTTLSELFKPAGLIQMSKSEDKDVCEESAMAIVPHSSYKDSYSSISDDVPLKDLVRKRDDVPLKDLVRKCDDVPLKDLVPVSVDMPLEDLVPESDEMPLKDLVQQSDDMPLKDLFRKSSTARKTSKVVAKPLPSDGRRETVVIDISNIIWSEAHRQLCNVNNMHFHSLNHRVALTLSKRAACN
ncbi:hypothetical protein QQ045_003005 [Rhodiola kirilowii]